MAGEHITRLDDPTLLPLARSRIAAMRQSGLQYGSQRFIVTGTEVWVQVNGNQSYISITRSFSLEMDSGIVDVGAVASGNPDKYLRGPRMFFPKYEDNFTRRQQNFDAAGVPHPTPWYLNPDAHGQLAGRLRITPQDITGKVRKDNVTASFSPRSSPPPEPDDPVDPSAPPPDEVDGRIYQQGDEQLLAKKRAAVYCPPSMFTGRARLYVQAMYGRALYGPMGEEVPTPTARVGAGDPGLLLSDYAGSGNYVRINFNTGVFLEPTTKNHWLLCPALGSITIYPLIADGMGERARAILKQGKLNEEDALHLETYILCSCRPDMSRSATLAITEIPPWASGYGWHWNWSGTTADMVRVTGSVPYDHSFTSSHYRLTATGTEIPDYDPTDPKYTPGTPEYIDDPTRSGSATWEAEANIVSGPHRFMVHTPVCCVVHPNWTNRYFGEDLEHEPIYWSEKLTINPSGWAQLFSFSDVPIYAFYKKDELQIARISLAIDGETRPGKVECSPGYVTVWSGVTYSLNRDSMGSDPAFLKVQYPVSGLQTYMLTCGNASVSVRRGGSVRDMYIEDSSKAIIQGPGPLGGPMFTQPCPIFLRTGRPDADGKYQGTYIPYTPWLEGASTLYQAFVAYSTSMFTSVTAATQKVWHGICGGIIPFYDAEAFYLVEDTWREHEDIDRSTTVYYGTYHGHDGGKIVSPGGGVTYVGWSTFETSSWPTGGEPTVYTPNEVTVEESTVRKGTYLVSSCGEAQTQGITSAVYAIFENGHADYVMETFKTISSAGLGEHSHGLIDLNWPYMPGMRNPVIVGWD